MDAICKECLWNKCVFAPKFLVYRGEIKGSETFFRLILSEKNRFLTKAIHYVSISEVKALLLTGKIGKACKARSLFVYAIEEIPAISQGALTSV